MILIGILLPVVASVRKTAFATATRQEISRIAGACQAYYGDYHSYPGPISENDIDGVAPATGIGVPEPIVSGGNSLTFAGPTPPITSSENLVLGLEGGLFLTFTPPSQYASAFGYQVSGVGPGPQSLNPLLNSQKQTTAYLTVQPAELAPQDASGNYLAHGPSDSAIPEFVDHIPGDIIAGPAGDATSANVPGTNGNFQFGPILYFRARKGAANIVNDTTPTPTTVTTYQYNFVQAAPYGFTNVSQTDYSLPTPNNPPTGSPTGTPAYDYTTVYFANSGIAGQPRGKDSFILISAGTDRVFGTKDDIFFSN